MADFSASDIDEAKRRVREMRNRAQSFVNIPEETPNNGVHRDELRGQGQPKNAPNRERGGSDFMGSLFGDMFKSDDSALILALIMILSREGADNMLILALLYILL